MEKQPVAKVHIFPLLNRGEPQPQEPYFKPTGYSWTKIMNDNASFPALILKERENRKLYSHYQSSGPSISSFKNCFPKGSGTGWVVRKLQSLGYFLGSQGSTDTDLSIYLAVKSLICGDLYFPIKNPVDNISLLWGCMTTFKPRVTRPFC